MRWWSLPVVRIRVGRSIRKRGTPPERTRLPRSPSDNSTYRTGFFGFGSVSHLNKQSRRWRRVNGVKKKLSIRERYVHEVRPCSMRANVHQFNQTLHLVWISLKDGNVLTWVSSSSAHTILASARCGGHSTCSFLVNDKTFHLLVTVMRRVLGVLVILPGCAAARVNVWHIS